MEPNTLEDLLWQIVGEALAGWSQQADKDGRLPNSELTAADVHRLMLWLKLLRLKGGGGEIDGEDVTGLIRAGTSELSTGLRTNVASGLWAGLTDPQRERLRPCLERIACDLLRALAAELRAPRVAPYGQASGPVRVRRAPAGPRELALGAPHAMQEAPPTPPRDSILDALVRRALCEAMECIADALCPPPELACAPCAEPGDTLPCNFAVE